MSKTEMAILIVSALLIGFALLGFAVHELGPVFELFEDGSFVIKGCLPWAICIVE